MILTKKVFLSALFSVIIALSIVACGGGGGSSSSSANASSSTYTAGAQIGEMVSFSVDLTNLTYSYVITKSAFGCDILGAACHTGSGTLMANSDGSYTPSQFPYSRLHILANGLMFGSIQVPVNGVNQVVPVIGMEKPATSVSDFADAGGTIYNWVSYQCTTPGGVGGTCSTKIGTARVNQDGTFYTCTGYNLSDTGVGVNSGNSTNCPASPYTPNTSNGRMIANGDGTWKLQTTHYTAPSVWYDVGTFIAFKDPTTSQRVAIFDINDTSYGANGWGFGEIVAASQITLSPADSFGTWLVNNNIGGYAKAVITARDGSSSNNNWTYTDNTGTSTGSLVLTLNRVDLMVNGVARGDGSWPGFIKDSTNPYKVLMLAGSGMASGIQIYRAGVNSPYIEAGYKQ